MPGWPLLWLRPENVAVRKCGAAYRFDYRVDSGSIVQLVEAISASRELLADAYERYSLRPA